MAQAGRAAGLPAASNPRGCSRGSCVSNGRALVAFPWWHQVLLKMFLCPEVRLARSHSFLVLYLERDEGKCRTEWGGEDFSRVM